MTKLPSLFCLSLLACSIQVAAQQNDATDNNEPTKKVAAERITVTANRKDNIDTDLAMSVHSVGKEELAIDNGQHPAESLNSLAGVLVEQLSGGQGHKAAIRMPVNTSGYYLYLQDNIPIQSPAFFNHNALWWSSFNSSVSRMEVLKGAGTALYGSGAVAATVNIISNPIGNENSTHTSATYGEDNYRKIQFGHSQRLNKEHGFSVSGSLFANDGWQQHTSSERSEINARYEYELSANQRLVTLFTASDLEQEMATSLTEEQYVLDRTSSGLSDSVLAVDPLRKSQYARLSSQWDMLTGNEHYSVIGYVRHRTNDYTATWNLNMPVINSSVNSVGLLALANYTHDDSSETTVGVDLELSEGNDHSFQTVYVKTSGWNSDEFFVGEQFNDDTTDYLGISPYIQHQRSLTDSLDLTIGARFDYAGYDFNNKLGKFGDIGHGKLSLHDRDDSFNHLSPKLSLNYHLSDISSIFVRYANSFRLPTAGSLYHISTKDSEAGISGLKPEVSDTYEIGYKANFASLSIDGAIYYMDVDDGIVNAFDDELGFRYLVNASRVIHKGFELAANWHIDEQWHLTAAYSKAKHQFDDYLTLSGNDMMNAPEDIANLRLRYLPDFVEGLSMMLEWQSVGDYWMDDANTRKYEGYQLTNLKLHYKLNSKLSLNARINNLTDDNYVQSASISYGKANITPGTPRAIYFGVDYQW